MSERFYFILVVLQESERGWFMGLPLVSVRPCVCVCVCCQLLWLTEGLAPFCSGYSIQTCRLNCDWWRSEFCTNEIWRNKTRTSSTQHAHTQTAGVCGLFILQLTLQAHSSAVSHFHHQAGQKIEIHCKWPAISTQPQIWNKGNTNVLTVSCLLFEQHPHADIHCPPLTQQRITPRRLQAEKRLEIPIIFGWSICM